MATEILRIFPQKLVELGREKLADMGNHLAQRSVFLFRLSLASFFPHLSPLLTSRPRRRRDAVVPAEGGGAPDGCSSVRR